MNLTKNIEAKNLALIISKKILVLSDLHIGYEEALAKQGLLVPKFQLKEVMKNLESIIKNKRFEIIIINGDLKHEFGRISEQEWRDTLKVIDFLASKCKKLLLIKGNHDTILGPIADKRNIELKDYYFDAKNKIYVTHGHRIPKDSDFKKAETVIIGHEHPAVSIHEGAKHEIYKCFLFGNYKNKKLIVMPSFHFVTEGTDIIKNRLLSPFLKNIEDFSVFAVADKIYNFGKIKKIN